MHATKEYIMKLNWVYEPTEGRIDRGTDASVNLWNVFEKKEAEKNVIPDHQMQMQQANPL